MGEGCKRIAGNGSLDVPSVLSDEQSTCKSFCGNDKAPFEKVCPGGSEPWKVCSECEGCKNIDSSDPGTLSTCESYCGSEKNPFRKFARGGSSHGRSARSAKGARTRRWSTSRVCCIFSCDAAPWLRTCTMRSTMLTRLRNSIAKRASTASACW